MLITKLYKGFAFLTPIKFHTNAKRLYGSSKDKYNEYEYLLGILKSKMMLDCKGDLIKAKVAFRRKPIIAYYFSASWCMPCKMLLPKIKEMYKECHAKPNGFEMIYASMDENKEIMVDYFKTAHGCLWFAIPFGDPAREHLLKRFDVEAVPRIIAVRVNDGVCISKNARKDIEELGKNVLLKWNPVQK